MMTRNKFRKLKIKILKARIASLERSIARSIGRMDPDTYWRLAGIGAQRENDELYELKEELRCYLFGEVYNRIQEDEDD